MPPLHADAVLRAEANAIHSGRRQPDGTTVNEIAEGTSGAELYQALYARHATALCLSGGGIRSASFALGVIEALAVHPRPAPERQAMSEEESLLSQFHYLSTVSGGGYIGSWLSAWIARAGFPEVWKTLVGWRPSPEEEPPEIAWLRAYSNYLTPKLGLFSADTWAAIALYVRNLILNWLVILPALCLLLLLIKGATVGAYTVSTHPDWLILLAGISAILMILVLRFTTRNRPTCNLPPGVQLPSVAQAASAHGPDAQYDPHRDEGARVAPGAGQWGFFWRCLVPALCAANFLALYMMARHHAAITAWPLWQTAVVGLSFGALLYLIGWLFAWPFKTCGESRSLWYWCRDGLAWTIAGAVYGALVGLGAHVFIREDLAILIGYAEVPAQTQKVLLLAIYGVPWLITAQLIAEMIFVGLTNWERGSDADREWFGRSTGWFAAAAIVWFAAAFLILVGSELAFHYLEHVNYAKYASGALGILSGLLSAAFGASGRSPATDQGTAKEGITTKLILVIAPPLFLIMLVVAISSLIDYLLFGNALMESPLLGGEGDWADDFKWLLIGFVVVVFVAIVAWRRVNINRFSIHALYRNRLIRAYLGASNPKRVPNPFTGFDEGDNCPMKDVWTPGKGTWQPFHVVNIALNVVASGRLSWQERKAEPFTASPLHCGTASYSGAAGGALGYRPTADYGDGLTLGTALAISGAAASPNMGYHSSPMVTLLLALFNVRLGWWLGNPGPPGEDSYLKDGPKTAILPFIYEMFGQTTDTRRYVYFSDGGHFENLGLYEMIRRRCRCIVVSDAGCDPSFGFEDLGNAVRKIEIDLGVYISFSKLRALKARSKDNSVIEGAHYAIGVIDYKTAPEWAFASETERRNVEDGYILYIKPGYHGTESADIVAYATANAAFPHETTADQFFSESQFQSYRTLGFAIMDGVLTDAQKKCDPDWPGRKLDDAAKPPPHTLCGLIKALALDPVAPKSTRPKVADLLKLLDADDLKEMRALLAAPKA